ncbi:unnamed protein product, partial [marine sediment metagenome]
MNGEKMSKSKGTFLSARDFLDIGGNPEYLRFFYASSLSSTACDFDFSDTEFRTFINSNLIAKFGNFIYRVAS